MASQFLWTGDAGDDNFGDSNNWINTATALPGVPGSSDTAVVQAAGLVTGSGTVAVLDLFAQGGTLTTQALSVGATSMALSGSLDLESATQLSITDDAVVLGTATVVQSHGSAITIHGSDGTPGDAVTAMTFGQNSGDTVSYTLTGLGTLIDAIGGNIVIGDGETATVRVEDGGTLEADNSNSDGSGNLSIGASGAKGSLTLTGAYSSLQLAGQLDVGDGGTGHFTLNAGADAELGLDFNPLSGNIAMVVGSASGGAGTVVVMGAGTRLDSTIYGAVYVGYASVGTMTFSAGATGNLGELYVGLGTTGSVVVTGAGTSLQLHDAAAIGYGSTGTLQLLAGAHMAMAGNSSDVLAVGSQSSSSGTLTVSGTGTVLSADNQQVQIGAYGTGHATLSAGAVLNSGAPTTSPSHTAAEMGTFGGSVGTLTVTDAGSRWTAHGEFTVGFFGKGTLLVENGGAVSSGNYDGIVGFMMGNQAGSSGTATVTGVGSKITNNGRFIVGNLGAGTLTISAGGAVTTSLPAGSTQDGAIIGNLAGGQGHVTVTGTGSKWTIGTDLIVGNAEHGVLTIGAGATVQAGSLNVAVAAAGTVNLSGTGAKLTIIGNASFGGGTGASVTVGAGSVLSVGGIAELIHGGITMAGGELSVTGTMTEDAGQSFTGYGTVLAGLTGGLNNTGAIHASGGTLSLIGKISGAGNLDISNGATLELNGPVSAGKQVVFAAASGELILDGLTEFAGKISGFVQGDSIDLVDIKTSALSVSGHTLSVHLSGGGSLPLAFAGTISKTDFSFASDGYGGTLLTHT